MSTCTMHANGAVEFQLRPPEWFGHLAGEFAGALVPPTDAAVHRAAVGLAKVAGSGHADAALHAVSALPPDLCPKLASALPPDGAGGPGTVQREDASGSAG